MLHLGDIVCEYVWGNTQLRIAFGYIQAAFSTADDAHPGATACNAAKFWSGSYTSVLQA